MALVTGVAHCGQCGLLISRLPATLPHNLECQSTNSCAFVDPPPVKSLTGSPQFVRRESISRLRHDHTSLSFFDCTVSLLADLRSDKKEESTFKPPLTNRTITQSRRNCAAERNSARYGRWLYAVDQTNAQRLRCRATVVNSRFLNSQDPRSVEARMAAFGQKRSFKATGSNVRFRDLEADIWRRRAKRK